MKKLSLLLFAVCSALALRAQYTTSGDTIIVNPVKFADPSPTGWAAPYQRFWEFPPAQDYEKILMYYTLKCDAATNHDQYPCGEWDYLTYTFLTDSSGAMDSTRRTQVNYKLSNGSTPNSVMYSSLPSWTRYERAHVQSTRTDTQSLSLVAMGPATTVPGAVAANQTLFGRAQYLWRATEITSHGGVAGDLTGLHLNVSQAGGEIRNFTLRIKQSAKDSLTTASYENGGFTEVFRSNVTFPASGNLPLVFHTPFTWDGTSNLVVEITYDATSVAGLSEVAFEPGGFMCGVSGSASDYYLDFAAKDVVRGSANLVRTGAQTRTIELWANVNAFNDGGLFQAGRPGGTGEDFSLRTTTTANTFRMQQWGTPDFNFTVPGALNAWHHYCVTYDGTATKIYVDGVYVTQKVYALTTGSGDFLLGEWYGARFDGQLDEVRVWDVALADTTIANWYKKSVTAGHPNFGSLRAYYPLNEGTAAKAEDASANNYDLTLSGLPGWGIHEASGWNRDLVATSLRPLVTFEQGQFTTTNTPVISVDSLPRAPFDLILFGNPTPGTIVEENSPVHPNMATDTLLVWNSPTQTISPTGVVTTAPLTYSDTLDKETGTYYSRIVEFEISRYITPYGINLDLTADGTRWIFDVSDYAPLFQGKKRLVVGNNQELLDLKFIMIKGTPGRKVRKIQNIYSANFNYAGVEAGTEATPVSMELDAVAGSQWRVKTRTSGHGFGAGENCAEFCPKNHYIKVNGQPAFEWYLWTECANNFVYPQGGTWVYDRTGWCPGKEATTYDFELTPKVAPGQTVSFDYDIDASDGDPRGNWVFQAQLVTYDAPTKTTDAELVQVMQPSKEDAYSRINPICGKPKVQLRNNGNTNLTSAVIAFGVEDGTECRYRWTGNLAPQRTVDVVLPSFEWFGMNPLAPVFYARIDSANSQADTYTRNNEIRQPIGVPPSYYTGYYFELKSNTAPSHNSWEIRNEQGTVVKTRKNLSANKVYRDTLNLPDGCYSFKLIDTGNDGLSWWANTAQGNGYLKLYNSDGVLVKTYQPDFGSEIYEQFVFNYELGSQPTGVVCGNVSIDEAVAESPLRVQPNPNSGAFMLVSSEIITPGATLEVWNSVGQRVLVQAAPATIWQETALTLDLAPGTYFLRLRENDRVSTAPFVVK